MTVTSADKDYDNLTITMVADFDASTEAVWDLWADPRKLERWWGPPTHPATFVTHDFTPGGEAGYYMTSPEGEKYYGWWRFESVNPPRSLSFADGFADSDGKPLDEMPVGTVRVELSDRNPGTRMTMLSSHASLEDMEKIIEMGAIEGMTEAMGQMDAILAEAT